MRGDKVFLDTNILVYAHDTSAGDKHAIALRIVKDLWASGLGVLSTQVLQEFFAIATKKIPKPLDISEAKEIVRVLLKWPVVVNNGNSILDAIDIHSRYKYSFWDSMIIESAGRGGASLLLSEDLNDGQTMDGVVIRNPFLNP
ncbi:MAG: PIN domain-containing protein [Nitrospirae bacterium]|nr:PIN domain-containing protein [Nitrospirota bacterium]